MTIRDRVTDVVQNWSKTDEFETTESLLTLWDDSGQAASVPFQQGGVMKLVVALAREFQTMFDLGGLIPTRFKPDGDIDTVDNLVDEVTFSPTVGETHAVFAGFAHPAAKALFVNAVADGVFRRLTRPTKNSPSKNKKATANKATDTKKKGPR